MNRIGEWTIDLSRRVNAQRSRTGADGRRRRADAARGGSRRDVDLSAIILLDQFRIDRAARRARRQGSRRWWQSRRTLATRRKLAVWGVHCVVAEDAKDLDDMVNRAGSIAFRDGFAKAGQRVIIVAGGARHPWRAPNMLRIALYVGPSGDADM